MNMDMTNSNPPFLNGSRSSASAPGMEQRAFARSATGLGINRRARLRHSSSSALLQWRRVVISPSTSAVCTCRLQSFHTKTPMKQVWPQGYFLWEHMRFAPHLEKKSTAKAPLAANRTTSKHGGASETIYAIKSGFISPGFWQLPSSVTRSILFSASLTHEVKNRCLPSHTPRSRPLSLFSPPQFSVQMHARTANPSAPSKGIRGCPPFSVSPRSCVGCLRGRLKAPTASHRQTSRGNANEFSMKWGGTYLPDAEPPIVPCEPNHVFCICMLSFGPSSCMDLYHTPSSLLFRGRCKR